MNHSKNLIIASHRMNQKKREEYAGAGGKAAVATRDAGGTPPGACGASGVGSRVRRGRRAARVLRAERAVVQQMVPLRAARDAD